MNMQSLILSLYRHSRELGPVALKQFAFSQLQELIRFDSGLWIEGVNNGQPYGHTIYLFNQTMEMIENYYKYAHLDYLNAYVAENPGKVINHLDIVPREEVEQTEIFKGHCQKYGMYEALAVSFPIPELSIYSFISLYRGKGADPFLPEDVELLQQIAPHMIEAFKNSIYLSSTLALTGSRRQAGAAIVDIQGCVHFATDGFRQRLLEQWPQWRGPQVPEPVRPSTLGGTPSINDAYVFAAHAIADDLFLLVVSDVPDGWSVLTQSEQRISLQLAHGISYKQIARNLDISPSTVTNHTNNIYRKLDIKTKTELANLLSGIAN